MNISKVKEHENIYSWIRKENVFCEIKSYLSILDIKFIILTTRKIPVIHQKN